MRQPPIPNVFIVGAAKSGTTALYRALDRHPDVYMSPIKEPCFFAPEVVDFTSRSREAFGADATALRAYLDRPVVEKRRTGIVLEWEQYLKLFRHARLETAIGEASVSYLSSAGAAGAIRARIPDARIVMVLRDPSERLFSQYSASRAAGDTTAGFGAWVDEHVSAEAKRRPAFGPVWTGRYATHVRRFFDCFPREQMRIYLYDEYACSPDLVARDLLEFLKVNPDVPIDAGRRHNVTMIPRWQGWGGRSLRLLTRPLRSLLPASVARRASGWRLQRSAPRPIARERARVIDMYADEIRALASLIGRDLSRWLDQ